MGFHAVARKAVEEDHTRGTLPGGRWWTVDHPSQPLAIAIPEFD
jgi:hypothetical protein